MRIIFQKRVGDTSLLNMRLILDVENPDLLKKIEFFTVYIPTLAGVLLWIFDLDYLKPHYEVQY